jgi:hypothetical protein
LMVAGSGDLYLLSLLKPDNACEKFLRAVSP